MSESDSNTSSKIVLARWTERFFAWLIDFVIISAIVTSILVASFGITGYEFEKDDFWTESMQYIPTSIAFFVYWVILEYKTGKTIGKKILNLRTVSISGETPDLKSIMVSSFGKAFLLPIDVFLGWVLTNEKRQRIFNKLGDTVVVKIKEIRDGDDAPDIKYLKD